ncbi:hypothetical protein [Pseudomonas syringae]|uniref:hypothetical protein n=1 Tax=Pseudomonas syringae TaxID=317 RepID=UPI0024650A8F|nr:hypothetical protein [Pseudomonas syringae]MDH4602385.1 hypothetical protein [Pseudomonas syringae pv. papulans]
MDTKLMLDTEGKALKIGAMYCCVSQRNGYADYGRLVRYCGKDAESGRELFADADTWEECSIHGEGLAPQLWPAVDPTTQGWPELAA